MSRKPRNWQAEYYRLTDSMTPKEKKKFDGQIVQSLFSVVLTSKSAAQFEQEQLSKLPEKRQKRKQLKPKSK